MRENRSLQQKPSTLITWRPNWRKEDGTTFKPKVESIKTKEVVQGKDKGKTKTNQMFPLSW